ncbi:MAG: NAD(P)/FAD-dependent oxidoreductase [Solirubrobacteraceae bacterium]
MILGGGYGGLPTARRLEKLLPAQSAKVTVVSDVNFMLYTPLLPGAAGGTLDPRHVVVPLREELKQTAFRLGHVTGLDTTAKTVTVTGGEGRVDHLPYDQLVVALGSTSRTLPIPGLAEHGVGFKTISEAIALRNRLVSTLERAEISEDPAERRALLTYVFVGAGYAGLEGIAELQDFAADVVEHYPRCRLEGMRFILVEARDRVMPEISASLADFAAHELTRRGIDIRVATTLEDVAADSVKLSDSEERVPCRTLCWTAGVKPVPIVAELGLPLDEGRIKVDRCCRVEGLDGVWAVGDAAAVPDPARPGEACPPTAQHAMRQGKVVAENITLAFASRKPKPFTYKTLGVFVDMGRYQAVAETAGIRWRGFPAWFLARTYHLALMPGYRRRLRITVDWTVDLLFPRDSSELGQLGHPPRLGEDASGQEAAGLPGTALKDGSGAPADTQAAAADGAVDADDATA